MTLLVFWHVVGQWHVHQDGYWQHFEAAAGSDCYARARSSAKVFQASRNLMASTNLRDASAEILQATLLFHSWTEQRQQETAGKSRRHGIRLGSRVGAAGPESGLSVCQHSCVSCCEEVDDDKASGKLDIALGKVHVASSPKDLITPFLQSTVQSRPIKPQTLNSTYFFVRPAKP